MTIHNRVRMLSDSFYHMMIWVQLRDHLGQTIKPTSEMWTTHYILIAHFYKKLVQVLGLNHQKRHRTTKIKTSWGKKCATSRLRLWLGMTKMTDNNSISIKFFFFFKGTCLEQNKTTKKKGKPYSSDKNASRMRCKTTWAWSVWIFVVRDKSHSKNLPLW